MFDLGSKEYRLVTTWMSLGSFLIFSNLYLFQPILPDFAAEFGRSATQANWLFAATTLTLALSLVVWAVISDAIGRKKVLLIGLYGAAATHLLMLGFPSYSGLVVCRGLLGVALAAYAAIAMAYLVEVLSNKAFSKAAGSYIAANSLGGIAGRLTGGIVSDFFDWQTAVVLVALLTLCTAAALQYFLPKEPHFEVKRPRFKRLLNQIRMHVSTPKVGFAMLIGGVNFALFVNLFSVLGFRLSEPPFSLPTSLTAMIFLCYLTGTVTASLSANWSRRYTTSLGVLLGTVVCIVGLLLAYFDNVISIVISLLLISAGAFFIHALAYAWVSVNAKEGRSTASALYLVHYYLGGSAGGFLLLNAWQYGSWFGVIVSSLVLYMIIVLLAVGLRITSLEG